MELPHRIERGKKTVYTYCFRITCGGEVLHSFLVPYPPEAVNQEVKRAGAISQACQQGSSWAACRTQYLERAAGQLILTAERWRKRPYRVLSVTTSIK